MQVRDVVGARRHPGMYEAELRGSTGRFAIPRQASRFERASLDFRVTFVSLQMTAQIWRVGAYGVERVLSALPDHTLTKLGVWCPYDERVPAQIPGTLSILDAL